MAASDIPLLTIQGTSRDDQTSGLDILHEALSGIGFIFVKHPLISQDEINLALDVSSKFFLLPVETKRQYLRTTNKDNNGYVALKQERLDPSNPPDLKECFNIAELNNFSVGEVKAFDSTFTELFEKLLQVSRDILSMMGKALQLKDPDFFVKCHQHAGKGCQINFTTMRLLYYPAVDSDTVKPGQIRCGEHIDYGSITLLFQDQNGGLQVKTSHGTYINVPYMKGAILVNLGALMQQWTSDKYLATPHRVLIPSDEEGRGRVRQSIAFFAHPDNDTMIECVDGSNKYPPITAADDIAQRFAKTY